MSGSEYIYRPRLRFSYTQAQWGVIDSQIKNAGKSTLDSYLRGKLTAIKSMVDSCPVCTREALGPKIQKVCYVSEDVIESVKIIANEFGVDPASLVARLILDPLLLGEQI